MSSSSSSADAAPAVVAPVAYDLAKIVVEHEYRDKITGGMMGSIVKETHTKNC